MAVRGLQTERPNDQVKPQDEEDIVIGHGAKYGLMTETSSVTGLVSSKRMSYGNYWTGRAVKEGND